MWHSESCGSSIFFCLRASAKPFSLCLPKSLFNGHFHIKVFWFDWSMHWKHSFSIQQWSQSQLCKVAVTIECPFWKLHAYSQCHCVENTQQRGLIYTIVEPNTQRLHLANLIFFFCPKRNFLQGFLWADKTFWMNCLKDSVCSHVGGTKRMWEYEQLGESFSLSFWDKQH